MLITRLISDVSVSLGHQVQPVGLQCTVAHLLSDRGGLYGREAANLEEVSC